jgi:hypothetical protein
MSEGSDISILYREFADALTEVLAENAVGSARRGRLARARAVVKKHLNSKLLLRIGKPCKKLVVNTYHLIRRPLQRLPWVPQC